MVLFRVLERRCDSANRPGRPSGSGGGAKSNGGRARRRGWFGICAVDGWRLLLYLDHNRLVRTPAAKTAPHAKARLMVSSPCLLVTRWL